MGVPLRRRLRYKRFAKSFYVDRSIMPLYRRMTVSGFCRVSLAISYSTWAQAGGVTLWCLLVKVRKNSENFELSLLCIKNKITVPSLLVLFPLYFPKFSLNTVSIHVKFGLSKEKIIPIIIGRRKHIYLILDTMC